MTGETRDSRVPVLLELFTSEGCSSCPPADRLLEKFDRDQPVAGADLIVLSEHVDYWNQLGWADPFSSRLYSERQREYANRLDGEVYTPELVVDGARGLVGSGEREAQQAIRDAARSPIASIQVIAERDGNKVRIMLHPDRPSEGVVYIALAHDAMTSQVLRGENAGRGLSHVAVVYSITKVSKPDREIVLDLSPNAAREKTRVVAFVEKTGGGKVIALGQARL